MKINIDSDNKQTVETVSHKIIWNVVKWKHLTIQTSDKKWCKPTNFFLQTSFFYFLNHLSLYIPNLFSIWFENCIHCIEIKVVRRMKEWMNEWNSSLLLNLLPEKTRSNDFLKNVNSISPFWRWIKRKMQVQHWNGVWKWKEKMRTLWFTLQLFYHTGKVRERESTRVDVYIEIVGEAFGLVVHWTDGMSLSKWPSGFKLLMSMMRPTIHNIVWGQE